MQYFGELVGTELQIANAISVRSGIYHTRLLDPDYFGS
jgi:hypothetical protein